MTTIYLVRHAEAEGNVYRRIQGQYDSRVTPRGLLQLQALAGRFASVPLDAVYDSGLYRTRLTARAIAEGKDLAPRSDPRFLEINMGPWEDLPFGWVELTDPEKLNRFSYHPELWELDGAETVQAVSDRCVAGLKDLARRHDGQSIAIATHGTALRTTLQRLFPGRASGHADNTAVTVLTWEDGVFYLKSLYDNSHLEPQISTLAHQKWWRDPEGRTQDENLWYRPMTKEDDQAYMAFRQDAWDVIYPGVRGFDGPGFLADAWRCAENEPRALVFAMAQRTVAGCLQLNMSRGKEDGAGYIPFFYLKPEFRGRELGVQLIGHAISVFRPLGRTKLQLSVAPSNERAIRLYDKLGFRIKQAGKTRKKMSLHLMEMDISVG